MGQTTLFPKDLKEATADNNKNLNNVHGCHGKNHCYHSNQTASFRIFKK
jgi:hypothetical protein